MRSSITYVAHLIAGRELLPIFDDVATIGRYEIERELGRGAMGVVYLAHDPHLHRQVAVKTYNLPDGISEEMAKQFHERFLREARAAASLSHPGIVTIYDAGEDPARGLPYIAMEYVQGQSLKQRLEKGDRLEPAWILSFGAVLADALHLAHKAGIVHRDIKPANILIREGDGAVKIADFGVARLKTSELTQTGASLGSPGYMSPEQIRGGTLDGRSDLFSLAVVLYETFSGKRPFHGDDLVSLAYSIAHEAQVPLTRLVRGCPAGLDQFFDRALSKDPDRRFPDGAAFKGAFLEVGRGLDVGRQLIPMKSDQTVADLNTMALPQGGETRPGLDGKTVASTPGPARRGRGGRLGLTIGALALISAGAAVAAWLWMGGPMRLKADGREARLPNANSPSQPKGSSEESALHHETSAASVDAGQRERALLRQQVASGEVEPIDPRPRISRPAPPRNIQLTVPAGEEIHITLDQTVGSAASQAGDSFTARITEPVVVGDRVAIPAGSIVHGHVSEAIPARKGLGEKAGGMSLSFDRVVTPGGTAVSISESLTRVGSSSGKKTAATIGGGAAGGALLGKLLGGSSKKTAVGSVLGGAIGTGIAAGSKGEDVELPVGSPLSIRLSQPLRITIQP